MKTKRTRKLLSLLLALALAVGLMPMSASAAYNGLGTESEPYIVTNWSDLETVFQKGGYIRLGADISPDVEITASNLTAKKNTTLDLNGHTISCTTSYTTTLMAVAGSSTNRVTLEILDSVGTGKVYFDCSRYTGDLNRPLTLLHARSYGTLIIRGGTFETKFGNVLHSGGGTTKIYGGVFRTRTQSTDDCVYYPMGELELYGGTFFCSDKAEDEDAIYVISDTGGAKLLIAGGTVYGRLYVAGNNDTDGLWSCYLKPHLADGVGAYVNGVKTTLTDTARYITGSPVEFKSTDGDTGGTGGTNGDTNNATGGGAVQVDKPTYKEGDFLLTCEAAYWIANRGLVVTGKVSDGSIKVGDTVVVTLTTGTSWSAPVLGLEMFQKTIDYATKGDTIGIELGYAFGSNNSSSAATGAKLWHKGGYTVSFNANGGSGSMSSVTGVCGSYVLPKCTFTPPEGKQFKCWSRRVGRSEVVEYYPGTTFSVVSDISFTASWEDVSAGETKAPVITTDSLSDGTVGAAYSVQLAATGENVEWSLYQCSLPAGLTLSKTGLISGTPTAEGQAHINVVAKSAGGEDKASYDFKIAGKGAPVIKTQPKPVTAKPDETATFTVEAEGTDLHYQWWGLILGSPKELGTDSATLTITKDLMAIAAPAMDVWCTVSNAGGEVVSDKARLTVQTGSSVDETPYVFPFTDVPTGQWYYKSVTEAHKMGLVNGKTDTTYEPDSNMTYAEAIKLAACMNQLYNDGNVTLQNGTVWYDTYFTYCLNKGIISASEYGGLYAKANKKITRTEYAMIFAGALPDAALAAKNTVPDGSIPDVKTGADGYSAIYKLYRAGVLGGNDDYGTFNPSSNIKRSEVAAILIRMMDETARVDAPAKLGQG